jgi:hypothetical protein
VRGRSDGTTRFSRATSMKQHSPRFDDGPRLAAIPEPTHSPARQRHLPADPGKLCWSAAVASKSDVRTHCHLLSMLLQLIRVESTKRLIPHNLHFIHSAVACSRPIQPAS